MGAAPSSRVHVTAPLSLRYKGHLFAVLTADGCPPVPLHLPGDTVLPRVAVAGELVRLEITAAEDAVKYALGEGTHIATLALPLEHMRSRFGTQAAFWVGFEEGDRPGEGLLNAVEAFEKGLRSALRRDCPKVGFIFSEQLDEPGPGCSPGAAPVASGSNHVLFNMIAGLHDTTPGSNEDLEVKLQRQREKYELEIDYLLKALRSQSGPALTDGDALSKAESEKRAAIQRADQLEVRLEAAEKAKDEAMKLFNAAHHELKWVSGQLTEAQRQNNQLRAQIGMPDSPRVLAATES